MFVNDLQPASFEANLAPGAGETFVDQDFIGNDLQEELLHHMATAVMAPGADAAYDEISNMLADLGDPYTRIVPPECVLVVARALRAGHAVVRCGYVLRGPHALLVLGPGAEGALSTSADLHSHKHQRVGGQQQELTWLGPAWGRTV